MQSASAVADRGGSGERGTTVPAAPRGAMLMAARTPHVQAAPPRTATPTSSLSRQVRLHTLPRARVALRVLPVPALAAALLVGAPIARAAWPPDPTVNVPLCTTAFSSRITA